jgi:hypothetical protein
MKETLSFEAGQSVRIIGLRRSPTNPSPKIGTVGVVVPNQGTDPSYVWVRFEYPFFTCDGWEYERDDEEDNAMVMGFKPELLESADPSSPNTVLGREDDLNTAWLDALQSATELYFAHCTANYEQLRAISAQPKPEGDLDSRIEILEARFDAMEKLRLEKEALSEAGINAFVTPPK